MSEITVKFKTFVNIDKDDIEKGLRPYIEDLVRKINGNECFGYLRIVTEIKYATGREVEIHMRVEK